MDMWNEPLTRENLESFYNSTVYMAYSSVLSITKETTRAEQAIVKSYIDVYQQRSITSGNDVIYVFGDVLLKNTNEIMDRYPLPDNINFAERTLDEYTRNFMLEKIFSKVDSTGYKLAEFISSDSKKSRSAKNFQKIMDLFPITPLLIIQLIIVSIIIWIVSYAAVTVPYRNKPLTDSGNTYHSSSLLEEYVDVLPYYPLNIDFPVKPEAVNPDEEGTSTDPSESQLAPVIVVTEASATRG